MEFAILSIVLRTLILILIVLMARRARCLPHLWFFAIAAISDLGDSCVSFVRMASWPADPWLRWLDQQMMPLVVSTAYLSAIVAHAYYLHTMHRQAQRDSDWWTQ